MKVGNSKDHNTNEKIRRNNVTIHNTGNDQLDLQLIQKEISGAIIVIVAYIVLIMSANQARKDIFLKERGILNPSGSNSSRLAALSSALSLLSNLILGEVAFARYREIEHRIKTGESTLSIIPNVNISNAYMFTILGNCLKTLGTYQRVQEQSQMTIV